MSEEKKIELAAMIIDQMLTKALMQAMPDKWRKTGEKNASAIEVNIPMPEEAIKGLKACRETLSDDKLKSLVDFNQLLSIYLSELIYRGLSAMVEELE